VDHLNKHFVDFVKNDNLGKISTWLIAQADLKGADCTECEELAQLHSMAVDFPKTGVPATLTAEHIKRLVSCCAGGTCMCAYAHCVHVCMHAVCKVCQPFAVHVAIH
jgi:hypothetical protein